MKTQITTYVLDLQNRIISIGGEWDAFADENDGTKLTLKDVQGRPIRDFIKGDATIMWVEALLQYSRILGKIVDRPYRCDSPDLKRFMRMRIVPEQCGVLHIEHELLSTQPRSTPIYIQYGGITMNGAKLRCSICGRLNITGWTEPRGNHTNASGVIVVDYTVCENCQRLVPVIS